MSDVHVGDLIEYKGKHGVVFEAKENEDESQLDYTPVIHVKIRWDDGTITECDEFQFHSPGMVPSGNGGLVDNEDYYHIVTPLLYVNVYLQDRAYGGSEEGGWWFNTETPVDEECVKCETEEEAEKVFEQKEAEYEEENKDRRPPSSVISEGHYRVRLEAWPAEPYPKRRPRYC